MHTLGRGKLLPAAIIRHRLGLGRETGVSPGHQRCPSLSAAASHQRPIDPTEGIPGHCLGKIGKRSLGVLFGGLYWWLFKKCLRDFSHISDERTVLRRTLDHDRIGAGAVCSKEL